MDINCTCRWWRGGPSGGQAAALGSHSINVLEAALALRAALGDGALTLSRWMDVVAR